MRRLLFLMTVLTICSCAVTYQQIATISSPDVKMNQDGVFRYLGEKVSIDYSFWSPSGSVSFVITNNTDKDIYLDLTRSFFIVNGMALDYYQNRTFISSSSRTVMSQEGFYGNNTLSKAGEWSVGDSPDLLNAIGHHTGDVLGKAASVGVTKSKSASRTENSGVEIAEKQGMWIPAHTSRSLNEFTLLEAPFRMCGFARNPSKNEAASMDFSFYGSPYAFENRLMLIEDGQDTPIINSFYISNITNYNKQTITHKEILKDCQGKNIREVFYNNQAANNKFFIDYIPDKQTDRIKGNNMIIRLKK